MRAQCPASIRWTTRAPQGTIASKRTITLGAQQFMAFDFLLRETDVLHFPQGATIFKAGDPADCMFGVVEGSVDIELDGRVVESIGPRGVFGEMALIDGKTRSATAIAGTECKLAVINEKRFLWLVEQTPRFALQMMQVITQRLRRAGPP
jgi:CRP-like cAMP-binding protein